MAISPRWLTVVACRRLRSRPIGAAQLGSSAAPVNTRSSCTETTTIGGVSTPTAAVAVSQPVPHRPLLGAVRSPHRHPRRHAGGCRSGSLAHAAPTPPRLSHHLDLDPSSRSLIHGFEIQEPQLSTSLLLSSLDPIDDPWSCRSVNSFVNARGQSSRRPGVSSLWPPHPRPQEVRSLVGGSSRQARACSNTETHHPAGSKGSRLHPPQRSRNRRPASWAMRSSSEGQM